MYLSIDANNSVYNYIQTSRGVEHFWNLVSFCWNLSGIFGILLESLESPRNLWNLWNLIGIIGIFGILSESLESYWNLWNPIGIFGILWNPIRIFRILSESLESWVGYSIPETHQTWSVLSGAFKSDLQYQIKTLRSPASIIDLDFMIFNNWSSLLRIYKEVFDIITTLAKTSSE